MSLKVKMLLLLKNNQINEYIYIQGERINQIYALFAI